MPKEHENTDIDPKHATLAVCGVHEKLAKGRFFLFHSRASEFHPRRKVRK